jgi:pyridoxine 5-phosphate synthase
MQDRDIHLLRQVCKTPFNLEMAATDAMVALALEVKPEQVTLVPEKREEVTTEGGLDVAGQHERMKEITARLKAAGIQVSMFIDPSASAEVGAPVVEFHTGEYANAHLAHDEAATERELERLQTASAEAQEAGILVNAGHGLNYRNVQSVAAIPGMRELNIGHALIAHSVFVGLERAVQEMITLIETA